jgi:hypothetical protein
MGNRIYFKIAGWVDLDMLLQVLGNNSKTVNNIKNDQNSKIYIPCKLEVNLITHLGVIALDTILKPDTLVMILTKFGFHWSSTFRGEDF